MSENKPTEDNTPIEYPVEIKVNGQKCRHMLYELEVCSDCRKRVIEDLCESSANCLDLRDKLEELQKLYGK